MSNSTDNTWPTVRIGISPIYPSVSPCVLDPNLRQCKTEYGIGIELEILLIVLNFLKLRPKFILSPDPFCGDIVVNQFNHSSFKATGLFKMLINDEIDMTGNTCGINKERILFANISYPVYYAKQVFWPQRHRLNLSLCLNRKLMYLRGREVASFGPLY